MSVSAFHTVSSASGLSESFSKLKKKKKKRLHVKGVDGISLQNFSDNLKSYTQHVSRSLRKGAYEPSELLAFFVPKGDGVNYRVIGIPTTIDRVVQLSLLDFISGTGFKFKSKNNYGFVKHGGVKKALQRVSVERAKNNYAGKVDIDSFFDSISRVLLKEKIIKNVRYPSLHRILKSFVDCELRVNPGDAHIFSSLDIERGIGVRQGMPVSPFFANLFLDDLDLTLERRGIKFVRYADDIICFGENLKAIESAVAIISSELESIGLGLKERKTVYAGKADSIEFLGLDNALVNGRYASVVSEEKFKSMKQEILKFGDFSFCSQSMMTLPQVYRKLQGMIDGYYGFYEACANADQVAMRLDHAAHECIKQLLSSVFNVDVGDMSKDKMNFLGLKSRRV